MKSVNRSVLVVRPKAPFVEWANSKVHGGDPVSAEFFARDCTAFLVPDVEGEKEQTLQQYFERLFEFELAEWNRDTNSWPEQRDLKTFIDWFDVEFYAVVVDAATEGLRRHNF